MKTHRLISAIVVALIMVLTGCSTTIAGTAMRAGEAAPEVPASGQEPSDSEPDEPSDTPSATQSQPEPAPETSAPEPAPDPEDDPNTTETYVYFVVEGRDGFVLARELRDIPTGDDGAAAAIAEMIAGPEDPDYTTTWNPKTQVLGVVVSDGVITVNLSQEAQTANVGSAGAAIMMPQLVWTVTEALGEPDYGVQLEINGELTEEMWGAISWEGPITRDDAEWVRMLVQIDTPREGAEVASPVTVTGDAAAFEATIVWRLRDANGDEIDAGNATTAEGMTFSEFSFTLELDPGTYTIEVTEDDPSDGEGGEPYVDTKTFTVTG